MSSSVQLSNELHAMSQVESALSGLSEEERARVLRWAAERFGLQSVIARSPGGTTGGGAKGIGQPPTGVVGDSPEVDAADLAEFFAAARPATDVEKALVVGYWFQYRIGNSELEAQAINTELKHLGHHVANITRAFDNLKARDPQLIVQTRKGGSSKQARKKYKLTTAGKKEVEKMLSREREE